MVSANSRTETKSYDGTHEFGYLSQEGSLSRTLKRNHEWTLRNTNVKAEEE
jgi:hypothetical protein